MSRGNLLWRSCDAGGRLEQVVDSTDDPTKQPAVQRLGHCVSHSGRLWKTVLSNDCLTTSHYTGRRQRLGQLAGIHSHQTRNCTLLTLLWPHQQRCYFSVCPSVAYIANNSRTQRPSVPKFGRKVPHLRYDSHASFKVKRSWVRVRSGRGHTVSAEPGGHTAVGCMAQW